MLVYYLAANLNESDLVFVAVDFEVTSTFTVHNAPDVKPVIFIVLSAVKLETLFVKTEVPSASFVTVVAIVTPAVGIAELTFTTIACDVPITAKIFPAPGSTFIEKATVVSTGGTGVVGVVGDVVLSPPLLHDDNIKGITTSKYLSVFIIIA